ncbi:heavy metal-binding domain-containing protein [Neosynechococcus sphagnicola]|uniref:heavy metal-binding domain-containing protein n=1 Tax=Neosynechococcus sphagnicola TaxID=1501145 RepID=UPI000690F25C|nr:heavy metal-binding domain-containing protein [Neosynechococcus sphagnicola]
MPLWESEVDRNRREAQEATRRALERGQIPYKARHRLEMQRRSGANFFTSDLTSNEHLLAREAGYEPLGLVMGTAFYKISYWGYFNGYQTYTGELTALSHAQLAARELAVKRLRQEAALLGANGVIGVRLKLRQQHWGDRIVEFTAIGTAIGIPNRPAEAQPFTSDLSGQEFWQLHQAGYYPKGIVFGVCSYYTHTDWNTRNLTRGGFFGRGSRTNQEVTQYTQGFQTARHLAISRLTDDIRQHQAEGAVGMHINLEIEDIEYELNQTTYHDLLTHFVAIGTSIVQDSHAAASSRITPLIIFDLATKKQHPLKTNHL